MAADLTNIVKAYDVRGVVPDEWDEPLAELFGAAFVEVTGATAIVIGHDMRPSSPGLSAAFARGAAACGVDVTLIGLCSTDQLYYASGELNLPGAMFTASHNPAQYNGIKLCRAGAAPWARTPASRASASWRSSGPTRAPPPSPPAPSPARSPSRTPSPATPRT